MGDWLVGRDREIASLRDLVAKVAAGTGGVILVEGEQGIGKTALLRTGLADAADLGCRVAWGTADELGQRFPLGLMAECLGMTAWTSSPNQGSATESGPLMPAGDPVVAGMERMLAAVDQWCAESPVVLVAEDLHWADEASVLVWHRLSRAIGQVPLLIAGSMRPMPGQDKLGQVRRGVKARGGSLLSLAPLAAQEVAEVVGRVVHGRPGRRLAVLAGQAGGNPLYARELADALVRSGRVRVNRGVAELVDEPRDPLGTAGVAVPTTLADVIEARLGLLSGAAADMLRWAAVLGQEFSVTDLQTVTGRPTDQLMNVVAEAIAAGVIADAAPRLGFRHGLIRQVVYEEMPHALRSALHLQAARLLAAAAAMPGQVAAHLVAAGTTEGWVRDWLAQAAPALSYQAPQVAAELLRAALAEFADDATRREALEADLVRVSFVLWQHDEVERTGTRLLAGRVDPNRRAEIAWFVGYALLRQGKAAEAVALVEQELTRLGMDVAHWARLRALNAMMLPELGRGDEMAGAGAEALASAEAAGDALGTGYALHVMFVVSAFRSDWPTALNYIDRALAVIGDDPQAIDLRLILMTNLATLAPTHHEEAVRTCEQALAIAEQAGAYRLNFIRTTLAGIYFTAGRWDDALAELETAMASSEPNVAVTSTRGIAALIAAHRDDWPAADRHLAAVADIPTREVIWPHNGYDLLLARAMAAVRSGSVAQAMAVLATVLDPSMAEVMPARYPLLPELTRLAVRAGDTEVAEAALEVAEQESRQSPTQAAKAATAQYCLGLVEADPAALRAAADTFRSADRPLEFAQALRDASVLLAARGDLQAARMAFTEAADQYEILGARWDLAQASAELRAHGINYPQHARRTRPTTGWDALTPTETKIAYLIGEGRSNPDVAARLFLSRNTVQTHVSHILAKLNARSRAEIIREALTHSAGAAQATA